MIIMMPIAFALECGVSVDSEDIPCQMTSSINYSIPCSSHIAKIYNASGVNVYNYTYASLGDSKLCYITWNITASGSYYGVVVNSTDSFNLTNAVDNMQLATIFGLGIAAAIMLYIAFKLEKEHLVLQLGLIFFSVILLGLIPAALVINTVNVIFYRVIMGFTIVFWLYVGVYFIYYILRKAEVIVPRQ